MSIRRTIGRRRLLLGALGMGATLLWRPVASRLFSPTPWGEPSERLVRLLEHRDSARIVGGEYLRAVPGEATPGLLASLVADRLEAGRRALHTAGDEELRRLLAAGVLADFEEGRTVELDGWVLSKTEARLCALCTLRDGALLPTCRPS
ncbi:MAG: hypothetical protein ACRDJG_05390 [Actinomycetota bacterium]